MKARRIWKIIGFLACSPFLLISLYLLLVVILSLPHMVLNNISLRKFEKSFAMIEHPRQTVFLASHSAVGNLGAASNHCDYLVAALRSTSLPKSDILAHYDGVTIPAPDVFPGERSPMQLWFFEREIPAITESDVLFNAPANWGVDTDLLTGRTLYIVYAEQSGAPPGADIRCH